MAKSYSDLLAARHALDAQIEAARKREAAGVIKRIREAIAVYGLTAEDVFGDVPSKSRVPKISKTTKKGAPRETTRKKTRVKTSHHKRPVKYSDGMGNTWSGGGSMANWLRQKLDEGHSLDEFLVEKVV